MQSAEGRLEAHTHGGSAAAAAMAAHPAQPAAGSSQVALKLPRQPEARALQVCLPTPERSGREQVTLPVNILSPLPFHGRQHSEKVDAGLYAQAVARLAVIPAKTEFSRSAPLLRAQALSKGLPNRR